MSHLATLNVQTLTRPTTAHSAAPVAQGKTADDHAAAAAPIALAISAAPAVTPRNTPAPAQPAVTSTVMSALIEAQSKLQMAAADHGANSGHATHVDAGQGGHHTDHGFHGKPVPPPAPEPKPVVIPNFDPSLPARAIAEAAKTLADEQVSAQARSNFVAASAERRADVFVGQGKAALAIFKNMQAEYGAWQTDQTAPAGGASLLKALYA